MGKTEKGKSAITGAVEKAVRIQGICPLNP